jgi:hypothetical protein
MFSGPRRVDIPENAAKLLPDIQRKRLFNLKLRRIRWKGKQMDRYRIVRYRRVNFDASDVSEGELSRKELIGKIVKSGLKGAMYIRHENVGNRRGGKKMSSGELFDLLKDVAEAIRKNRK